MDSSARYIFHMVGNAHLDPVWLWDWREGLSEGIATIRAALDMLDEFPFLTVSRGEASLYENLALASPADFKRVAAYVKKKRWEPVGGVYVQPDTNLQDTAGLLRQFRRGRTYFQKAFGAAPTAAWAADSFGHPAGLPEILHAAGMESFFFTRPFARDYALPAPAFWWVAASGAKVLGYRPMVGWYGSERTEMRSRLDGLLEAAARHPFRNVGVFYGLGNHGGGPTRRQILDALAWADERPEVELRWSGMHALADALRAEVPGVHIPEVRGELNYTLRGCYASCARFKAAYRKAEADVARAEWIGGAMDAAGVPPIPGPGLDEARDGLLFNAFHDILPGTSIERAMDEQVDWIGGVRHAARAEEGRLVAALARHIDTAMPDPGIADHPKAVPMLVVNPHPWPVSDLVEIEACLDARPLGPYHGRPNDVPVYVTDPDGRRLSTQRIEQECNNMPRDTWRARMLAPITLPAGGYTVLGLGFDGPDTKLDFGPAPAKPATVKATAKSATLDNGMLRVVARVGAKGVAVARDGRAWLGGAGLGAEVVEDVGGSWGGADGEKPQGLNKRLATWKIQRVEVRERGPWRSSVWLRLAADDGARGRLDLTISLVSGDDRVHVNALVLWDGPASRLKLVFPFANAGRKSSGAALQAEYGVPGGTVKRQAEGEVPSLGWARVATDAVAAFGVATDTIYNFDLQPKALRATVTRGTRYSCGNNWAADDAPWRPATDAGSWRFKFVLVPGDRDMVRVARQLEQAPYAAPVVSSPGDAPRAGSLWSLSDGFEPVTLERAGADWIVWLRETTGRAHAATLTWGGHKLTLGSMKNREIAGWTLSPVKQGKKIAGWKVARFVP